MNEGKIIRPPQPAPKLPSERVYEDGWKAVRELFDEHHRAIEELRERKP